ncbi:hypothetical protein A9R05_39810 (plasmid) [Burkholderia sp. KK1]|nr:hypothetical protein A9R05_39810 [Burkholderia sp. KK1]
MPLSGLYDPKMGLASNARRQQQLVDELLVARDALVIHDGMMMLVYDEPPPRWRVSFKADLQRIDAALQQGASTRSNRFIRR